MADYGYKVHCKDGTVHMPEDGLVLLASGRAIAYAANLDTSKPQRDNKPEACGPHDVKRYRVYVSPVR